MKADSEFLILGGGIAGLATAIALRKIGKDVLVAEAADAIRPVGAGIALAANAMKALSKIGVADAVTPKGNRLRDFSIYDQSGKLISKTHAHNPEYGNFTIHRADLHSAMLSFLDEKRVLCGKRSVRFDKKTEEYTVFFEDGSSLSAKHLIVAEGIHSPIRRQLLPNSLPRFAGYTCWRGIADNTHLRIQETSESWGRKGRFGIVPLQQNQVYWFACVNAPHADSEMKDFKKEELMQIFGDFHQPIPELLQATTSPIVWNDIADLAPLSRFAFGDILLVGDAAHATTPNMGQGACMALEDAAILMACLDKNADIPEAFLAFEKRRLPRTRQIVIQSRTLGKIAQLENPIGVWLRNLAFRTMPASVNESQLQKLYHVDLD